MSYMAKTVVITGASDGIGAEAASQLKSLGNNVIIVGRSEKKTKSVAERLGCPYHIADFSKLSDVIRLAEELSQYEKIDVLANNAGAMFKEKIITDDGLEKTFQVNVLSEFLLTRLLCDKLCNDKTRVIQTSSIAANLFGRNFNYLDIQGEEKYSSVSAYGESKLCNILFTYELHKRYHSRGITALAFEPGVVRSNFASEASPFFNFAFHSFLKYLFTISKEKSARRLLRLVLGEEGTDFVSGGVYSEKREFKVKFKDKEKASKALWEYCEKKISPLLS